jgi:hypothetical protein
VRKRDADKGMKGLTKRKKDDDNEDMEEMIFSVRLNLCARYKENFMLKSNCI